MANVKHLEGGAQETAGAPHNSELMAEDEYCIFDDPEELIALAQESFKRAAKKAVAENDALGIPTHYSVGGKLFVHMPPAKKTTSSSE
ncbi:MAG: hypothetical protein HQK97_04925 [Nitrospirae bacterium]|nr:hypothetical protein [Nitrospirota bacterium]